MEEAIQQRIKGLYESDKFICPNCQSIYDSLTVQTLEMDGFDAHFICKCGTKVELDDKSAKEDIYSSQQKRFEDQVKTLKKCLYDAWGMEVPEFPLFIRKADKTSDESPNKVESSSVVCESVGGAESSVVSDGSGVAHKSSSLSYVSSDPGKFDSSSLVGRKENKKIKFHMKVTGQDSSTSPLSKKIKPSKSKERLKDHKLKEVKVDHEPYVKKPQDEPDEMPDFYISKLNKTVTLMEAQDYQQHMTNLEFENFVELQDKYLNVF